MSELLALRTWRKEDAPDIQRLCDDIDIAKRLRDGFPNPYKLADAEAFIDLAASADPNKTLMLAIESQSGELMGSIGLFVQSDVYRRSAEMGYWLGKAFWGRGVMPEAIREICREGFSRFDIVRIYAEPYADNPQSRRALEKSGFRLEGVLKSSVVKCGKMLDSCIYAILREEFEKPATN